MRQIISKRKQAFLTVKETNYWAKPLRKQVELSALNVFKSSESSSRRYAFTKHNKLDFIQSNLLKMNGWLYTNQTDLMDLFPFKILQFINIILANLCCMFMQGRVVKLPNVIHC